MLVAPAAPDGELPTVDNGERTVKARVADDDDGFRDYELKVTIRNVAPSASLVAPAA